MNENKNFEYLLGINPVYSVLKKNSGRRKIYEIIISRKKKDSRIQKIISEAKKKNIRIKEVDQAEPQEEVFKHQGVCALVSPYNYYDLGEYLAKKEMTAMSRLAILDGITDMGNFGSIVRNCSAFGFEGIIIGKRRSAALNRDVSKISAGALEEIKIFRVVNIVNTINELKKHRFWIYGTTLDEGPEVKHLNEVDFGFPLVVVLGSEDKGIGRLVEKNCDVLVSIRQTGKMQSLNVSVASGIMFHAIQERIAVEK